ncbi:MAG: hypothetical protein ACYC6Y_22190 [Thermoguttaceae bacterium]
MRVSVAAFRGFLPVVLATWLTSTVTGAGFRHDENFTVLAEDDMLAADVLASANRFRQRVAHEWLGAELPPSVGETVIHVTVSDQEDRGLTWAVDSPNRSMHKIWLTTSRDRANGSTLQHEIAHIVLATRYPQRLPAWADEGIAGTYDEEDRISLRRQILRWYGDTGNWPGLESVFQAPTILNTDKKTYAVAVSVTEYLLTRADRPTFVEFAAAGQRSGWDRALQDFYRIDSVSSLQQAWQAWASGSAAPGGSPIR